MVEVAVVKTRLALVIIEYQSYIIDSMLYNFTRGGCQGKDSVILRPKIVLLALHQENGNRKKKLQNNVSWTTLII